MSRCSLGRRSPPGLPRPLRRALLAAAAAAVAVPWRALAATNPGGAGAFEKGLLWRLTRGGTPESYAFGTIHIADARVTEPPAAVLDALARARSVAMELITGTVADERVFDLEQLEEGRRLEPLLGTAAYARARAQLAARGVPERVIERMKPWAAMMAIARVGTRDASLTLDRRLLAAARARRLRIEPLEFIEEQIASFDTIPLDSQIALLKHVLEHRDALEAETESTIQAWLNEDLAELARFPDRMEDRFPGLGPHYRRLIRHVIHDRTVLMHHRLALPLRAGRVFVAVGALHLHGEKGLLAMLSGDGYRAVPLR